MAQEEIEKRLKELKSLLNSEAVKDSYEIKGAVESEIEDYELKLKEIQCELTFGKLVGKYYKYQDKRNPRDVKYLHIISASKEDFVATIVSIQFWRNKRGVHIYEEVERACHVYELCYFTEITKEEFKVACNAAALEVINNS